MIIGFTGTRNKYAVTDIQSEKLAMLLLTLDEYYNVAEVHHGDCVGADEVCHFRACEQGLKIVIHPPVSGEMRAWCQPIISGVEILEPKEYLDRNTDIVLASDMLIAMPEGRERVRSGTWSTVRKARTGRKPIAIIYPDGSVAEENWDRMPA